MWKLLNKVLALTVIFSLILEQSGFAQVPLQLQIPAYINGYVAADRFRPVQLRSLSFDPGQQNFNLFLDKGDQIKIGPGQISRDAKLLMQYFRIGLALPNDTFWVNLRPDAADQIIDPFLEKTDVGQVMLAADLQLKKDLANFTSPNTEEGRLYWDKLYAKANTLFNEQEISIPTLTRPWIVPGEVIVRETNSGCHIFKASLKVCLEQDYIKDSKAYNFSDPRLKELNDFSSQLIRESILPKLTREVNSSKKYASLRQVYYSLILAQWFKEKYRGQQGEYAKKIDGFDLNGLTSAKSWKKEKYFNAYNKSFKKGEYNLSENRYTAQGASIRQYFSGGMQLFNALPDGGNQAGLRIQSQGAILDPANELIQVSDDYAIVNDKTALPATEAKKDGGNKEVLSRIDAINNSFERGSVFNSWRLQTKPSQANSYKASLNKDKAAMVREIKYLIDHQFDNPQERLEFFDYAENQAKVRNNIILVVPIITAGIFMFGLIPFTLPFVGAAICLDLIAMLLPIPTYPPVTLLKEVKAEMFPESKQQPAQAGRQDDKKQVTAMTPRAIFKAIGPIVDSYYSSKWFSERQIQLNPSVESGIRMGMKERETEMLSEIRYLLGHNLDSPEQIQAVNDYGTRAERTWQAITWGVPIIGLGAVGAGVVMGAVALPVAVVSIFVAGMVTLLSVLQYVDASLTNGHLKEAIKKETLQDGGQASDPGDSIRDNMVPASTGAAKMAYKLKPDLKVNYRKAEKYGVILNAGLVGAATIAASFGLFTLFGIYPAIATIVLGSAVLIKRGEAMADYLTDKVVFRLMYGETLSSNLERFGKMKIPYATDQKSSRKDGGTQVLGEIKPGNIISRYFNALRAGQYIKVLENYSTMRDEREHAAEMLGQLGDQRAIGPLTRYLVQVVLGNDYDMMSPAPEKSLKQLGKTDRDIEIILLGAYENPENSPLIQLNALKLLGNQYGSGLSLEKFIALGKNKGPLADTMNRAMNKAIPKIFLRAQREEALLEKGTAGAKQDGGTAKVADFENLLSSKELMQQFVDKFLSDLASKYIPGGLIDGSLQRALREFQKAEKVDPELIANPTDKYRAQQAIKFIEQNTGKDGGTYQQEIKSYINVFLASSLKTRAGIEKDKNLAQAKPEVYNSMLQKNKNIDIGGLVEIARYLASETRTKSNSHWERFVSRELQPEVITGQVIPYLEEKAKSEGLYIQEVIAKALPQIRNLVEDNKNSGAQLQDGGTNAKIKQLEAIIIALDQRQDTLNQKIAAASDADKQALQQDLQKVTDYQAEVKQDLEKLQAKRDSEPLISWAGGKVVKGNEYRIKKNSPYFKENYGTARPIIIIEGPHREIMGDWYGNLAQANPGTKSLPEMLRDKNIMKKVIASNYLDRARDENLPGDDPNKDEVFYGKISYMGNDHAELVHISELEEWDGSFLDDTAQGKDGGDVAEANLQSFIEKNTIGVSGVPDLVKALTHSNSLVRRGAAKELERLGEFTPEMKQVMLVEDLSDPDSKVRSAAAEALDKSGKLTKSLKIIRYVADLSDPDKAVRIKAAEALGEIGEPHTIEPLLIALRDADNAVRLAAVVALGKIGDPRAIGGLHLALGNFEVQDRYSVVIALQQLSQINRNQGQKDGGNEILWFGTPLEVPQELLDLLQRAGKEVLATDARVDIDNILKRGARQFAQLERTDPAYIEANQVALTDAIAADAISKLVSLKEKYGDEIVKDELKQMLAKLFLEPEKTDIIRVALAQIDGKPYLQDGGLLSMRQQRILLEEANDQISSDSTMSLLQQRIAKESVAKAVYDGTDVREELEKSSVLSVRNVNSVTKIVKDLKDGGNKMPTDKLFNAWDTAGKTKREDNDKYSGSASESSARSSGEVNTGDNNAFDGGETQGKVLVARKITTYAQALTAGDILNILYIYSGKYESTNYSKVEKDFFDSIKDNFTVASFRKMGKYVFYKTGIDKTGFSKSQPILRVNSDNVAGKSFTPYYDNGWKVYSVNQDTVMLDSPFGKFKISRRSRTRVKVEKWDGTMAQEAAQDGGTKQAPEAPGGIDFRALPIVPSIGSAIVPGAGAVMPQVSLKELDNQWKEIQHTAQNAELPYENMKQFVSCCNAQKEALGLKQEVFAYVVNLLKLEEERAIATPDQLKEIVALVAA